MGVSKFNSEGYYDPTWYSAASHIVSENRHKRFRPIVYICSPYSGDVAGNVKRAQEYCRLAVDRGYIPIAPHLLFPQFMKDDDPADRELAMFMDLVLMSKCREVWVFGNTISEGMTAEIQRAEHKQMPVRYFDDHGEEVGV